MQLVTVHASDTPNVAMVAATEREASHAAARAAAARKTKSAHAANIFGGGGGGKAKAKHRRDAVSDRQHAALKRSAARFFRITAPRA